MATKTLQLRNYLLHRREVLKNDLIALLHECVTDGMTEAKRQQFCRLIGADEEAARTLTRIADVLRGTSDES